MVNIRGVILKNIYKTHISNLACIFCNKYFEGIVCQECIKLFVVRHEPYCLICGIRIVSEHTFCSKCKTEHAQDSTFIHDLCPLYSLWTYNAATQYLITRYKIEGCRILGYYLASQYIYMIKDMFPYTNAICVIPMPANSTHTRAKGFDHMKIAMHFMRILCDFVIYDCILRKSSHEQKSLNLEARQQNMRKSLYFRNVNRRKKLDLSTFDRIVLLDDVITTGATIQSARQVLILEFPEIVNKVVGISLVRTEY